MQYRAGEAKMIWYSVNKHEFQMRRVVVPILQKVIFNSGGAAGKRFSRSSYIELKPCVWKLAFTNAQFIAQFAFDHVNDISWIARDVLSDVKRFSTSFFLDHVTLGKEIV